MVVEQLSEYINGALDEDLPANVATKASYHLLDSVAAVVSGSHLPAGRAGAAWSQRNTGPDEALVIGTMQRTSATHAALVNGMSAHADETDDSHEPSRTHPGCGIVPAALAVAERDHRSGTDLLRAVTLGYDLAGRMNRALWPEYMFMRGQSSETHLLSTHAIGSLWGATAAAGALAGLSPEDLRYLLSYSAQQTAGIMTWLRDVEHIEKAFVFAGMGATNAIRGLTFVEAGWPGVRDVFDGHPNYFEAFGNDSDPEILVTDLGTRFVVMETNLKRFSVGSPCQAPLQALIDMVRENDLNEQQVRRVQCELARAQLDTVGDPDMPDICLPYLLDVALNDGDLTFASAHDLERFARWQAGERDPRIEIVSSDEMTPSRQAIVTITMQDGSTHNRHEKNILGSPGNPMDEATVVAKAMDLCAPVLSDDRAANLCDSILHLDQVDDCRDLQDLLSVEG